MGLPVAGRKHPALLVKNAGLVKNGTVIGFSIDKPIIDVGILAV